MNQKDSKFLTEKIKRESRINEVKFN